MISIVVLSWLLPWVTAWSHGTQTQLVLNSSWETDWQARQHSGFCELALTVAEYGEARFVSNATSPLSFEFQSRKDFFAATTLTVSKKTPEWHPQHPTEIEMGNGYHVVDGGIIVQQPLATAMLLALREGFDITIGGSTKVRDPASLYLLMRAQGLRPGLDEYLKCAQSAVDVSWAHVSRTRVNYAVDTHALAAESEQALDGLIGYVKADAAIQTIFVDGHTDSTGDKRANHQLAKRRAQSVEQYLRSQGLIGQKIVVRYHGARYPIASNQSVDGKRRNRRTTVRLQR
ncbi:MAG: OmpA family protein [Gammaproteobacteria bacterium]|nr:OmpA family protein [Gammaproteobacteria bacterium]